MTDMVSCLLALIDAYCPELTELHPEDNERYPWSDLGNGNLYADFFKSIARYTSGRRIWYIFDGRVWRPDPSGLLAMELCKQLAAKLKEYVSRRSLSLNNRVQAVRQSAAVIASDSERAVIAGYHAGHQGVIVVDVKFGSGQAVAALVLLLNDDFLLLMVDEGQLAAVHGGLDVLHHLRPQADFLCVVVDDIAKGALGLCDLISALWDVVGLGGVQPLQLPGQVATLVEVHIELHTSFQAGEVECTRADAVAVFIHLLDDVRGVTTSGRVFPRAAAHQVGAGLVLMNKGVQRGLIGLLGTSVAVWRLGLLHPEGLGVAGALPLDFNSTITISICGELFDRAASTALIVIDSKFGPRQRLSVRVCLSNF